MGEVAWLRGGRKRSHWRMGEVAWILGGKKKNALKKKGFLLCTGAGGWVRDWDVL